MNELSTPLQMAARVADAVSSLNSQSLPEFTAPTRLSPIVLLDKSVLSVDQGLVKALLQTVLSIYTAHYLQGINIAMHVDSVNVMRLLNQFSTDQDVIRSAGTSRWLGNESFDSTQLPIYGMESAKPDLDKTIASIVDESNLALGKVLEVKVQVSDANIITIPITATLMPKSIASQDLINIIASQAVDKSVSGRYHSWRSGEIEFIKDYLLNLDLIERDRKAIMADSTGLLAGARSKKIKSILNTLLSGFSSPNVASSIVVVSRTTAQAMEVELKGKFKSHATMAKVWNATTAMMLVVVDTTMERFKIYQRGISEVGEYTLDDIKQNSSKANGVDIESVLAAYKLGDSPSL